VDCASIPENLLESELFGYEKGAFTDARTSKSGILELANNGSLLLDEIGDLSLGLQAKLLRVLQEHKFRRLGGKEEISVDFRVISATNQDIIKLIKEKKFRSDLYYRINVIYIKVPPLRERKESIPFMARHFLKIFSERNKKNVQEISEETLNILMNYSWPGNVREMQNVIEGAVSLCEKDIITPEDLPPQVRKRDETSLPIPSPSTFLPFKEAKKQWVMTFERSYLQELLKKHNGNISATAKEAGVDRKTIHRLIKKMGIEIFDNKGGDENMG
jgi:transcriptional regulator with PAS, ATPase and Fis domain